MLRNVGTQKKVDFLLGEFKLYKECNNISLLKLQVLKNERVTNEKGYVFLIGDSNLIKETYEFLEGNNGVECLGRKITIDLDFFFQLQDSSFISHKLFKDESSWTEVLEYFFIFNNCMKIKEELLNNHENEKDSLFLNYEAEATKIKIVWQPLEEMKWYNAKNILIRELKREVRNENQTRNKIEQIKIFSNRENEVGKWIYEVFFSDSTKLRIKDKTPSEILNDLEAELAIINSVSLTLSGEDDTRTAETTEKRDTISKRENEREEVLHSVDTDEENEEELEITEEFPSTAPYLSEREAKPDLKKETVSTTDEEERVDSPKVSLLEKIGGKNFVIGTTVIIAALILVPVTLIIKKKKVNKTSPNKLQPEQPTDKKGIDHDSFAY